MTVALNVGSFYQYAPELTFCFFSVMPRLFQHLFLSYRLMTFPLSFTMLAAKRCRHRWSTTVSSFMCANFVGLPHPTPRIADWGMDANSVGLILLPLWIVMLMHQRFSLRYNILMMACESVPNTLSCHIFLWFFFSLMFCPSYCSFHTKKFTVNYPLKVVRDSVM